MATGEFRIYLVGGAVRDRLLGLVPGDRDWVVVGATPAQAQYPGAPEGGTLRNVYSTGSGHCDWYGSYGVQNNMWDFYLCEVHPEYPYLEFLWSFDYE